MSVYLDTSYETIRQYWKKMITDSRYKSQKDFIKNGKKVTIIRQDNNLIFEPFKTRVTDKMFVRAPEKIKSLDITSSLELIGKTLKDSWKDCVFDN